MCKYIYKMGGRSYGKSYALSQQLKEEGRKMKTNTTKILEKLLENHFNNASEFYVFECTYGWVGNEIVDCIMYNCQREVCCYEIKQSVQDFHSKNKLSFFGNKNYFVMPYELYEKVKEEIAINYPKVGVYVAIDRLEQKEKNKANPWGGLPIHSYYAVPIGGFKTLYCIKPARRMELKADKEVILSSMLRSMQRDFPLKLKYDINELLEEELANE